MAPAPLASGRIVSGRTRVMEVSTRSARVDAYEAVLVASERPVVLKLFDASLGEAAHAALQSAAAVSRELPRGQALEVIEVGIDAETGCPYVVTERATRPSLAHLVQLCPLPPSDVVAMVRSLARALGAAHERGLPHLGLKPSNVFVGPPPGCEVQLGDFGSMPARSTSGTLDPVGAPWVSPEQAFGGLPPGVSSDVFSAALVVFFAMTGKPYWRAFASGGDPSSWEPEIWAPRTPASVRAKELGATLEATWDPVFESALDVDPARRPRSIAELAESLARVARGESALAAPAPVVPRFEMPAGLEAPTAPASVPRAVPSSLPPPPTHGRARVAWIAGAVALGILVATGVGVARLASRDPPRAPSAATPPATPSTPSPANAAAAAATSSATAPPSIAEAPTPPPPPSPGPAAPTASASDAPPSMTPEMAMLVVSCNPPCDSIWVDGHPASDAPVGHEMPPGVHMVGANLAHHASKVQPVLLRRGKVTKLDVTF